MQELLSDAQRGEMQVFPSFYLFLLFHPEQITKRSYSELR